MNGNYSNIICLEDITMKDKTELKDLSHLILSLGSTHMTGAPSPMCHTRMQKDSTQRTGPSDASLIHLRMNSRPSCNPGGWSCSTIGVSFTGGRSSPEKELWLVVTSPTMTSNNKREPKQILMSKKIFKNLYIKNNITPKQ